VTVQATKSVNNRADKSVTDRQQISQAPTNITMPHDIKINVM